MIQAESSGNNYIEVLMPNGETVRISKIDHGWTGGICDRINLADTNNRVRPGAEIPKDILQQGINALNKLK